MPGQLAKAQLWQQGWYFLKCAVGRFDQSRTRCPHCGCRESTRISRKWLVTCLRQCAGCNLRYRVPQDKPEDQFAFYQEDYSSSLATECPAPGDCARMMETHFASTEKDFSHRIQVVEALGVTPGSRILDYGASWGYGTWQFREGGYDAIGFEISKPRAEYARRMLDVRVVDETDELPGGFDCMFSCHVVEHLPSPGVAIDLAGRLLKPGGLFIAFTPNGSDACRLANPKKYEGSWGRLHPLYLDDGFYSNQFHDRPHLLCSGDYGGRYPLESLMSWDQKGHLTLDLSKRELLFAAVY